MIRSQLSVEREVGASCFFSLCEVGQVGFCLDLVVSTAEGLEVLTKEVLLKFNLGFILKGWGGVLVWEQVSGLGLVKSVSFLKVSSCMLSHAVPSVGSGGLARNSSPVTI